MPKVYYTFGALGKKCVQFVNILYIFVFKRLANVHKKCVLLTQLLRRCVQPALFTHILYFLYTTSYTAFKRLFYLLQVAYPLIPHPLLLLRKLN